MKSPRKDYRRRLNGNEGIDYVRCRICGDHRRVVSARHLGKHDITRDDYIATYNLSPDQLIAKGFRMSQSSRPGYEPLGKREWKVAIRKVYQTTGNVFAGYLQKHHAHIYNLGVWLYGDWDKALCAAGFDPETTRQTHLWDREKVIERIIQLRRQTFPLSAVYISRHRRSLFAAARRRFGTWNKALRAAGVIRHRPSENPLEVLRMLRALKENKSNRAISAALKSDAVLYFGSVKKAIAVSKTHSQIVNGWNKPKIISLLVQLHGGKHGSGFTKIHRSKPAIISAAQRHFGSWRKALSAAGIPAYSRQRPEKRGSQERRSLAT